MISIRRVRNIALVSAGLTAYSLSWRFLLARAAASSSTTALFHQRFGASLSITGIVMACVALSGALVFAVESRDVRTMKGAVVVGLLVAVLALPASIGFSAVGATTSLVAIRMALSLLGFVGCAIGAVVLRR